MKENISQQANVPGGTGVRKKRGISGSTLKLIAVISMVIDHIGAGILGRYLYISGLGGLDASDAAQVQQWIAGNAQLFTDRKSVV